MCHDAHAGLHGSRCGSHETTFSGAKIVIWYVFQDSLQASENVECFGVFTVKKNTSSIA